MKVLIYHGAILEIWIAWQEGKAENYALGPTEREAREALSLRPMTSERDEFVARCGEILGRGQSTAEAYFRLLNLVNEKIDWRHLFFRLIGKTGDSWSTMAMHPKEMSAINRELGRRRVAGGLTNPGFNSPG